jgi:BirA family biotin operon repressor/biotin-[acetyl-CoA-carboxylase] ligase
VRVEEIKRSITGELGREIVFYEKLDSTNSAALDFAEKEGEGLVVLANSQEKGRGRRGRVWISPAGVNIYMSIVLKPETNPADTTLITLMAAVACATALRNVTGIDVRIKWPNDLMVSDKKLGGILTELKVSRKKIAFVIVGIGINLNIDIETLPAEIRDLATSIRNETGKKYSRESVVAALLNEMSRWYSAFKKADRETILSTWRSLNSTLGRQVVVAAGQGTYEGLAESVDDEGMLLLRLRSGEVKRINSGDLRMLR